MKLTADLVASKKYFFLLGHTNSFIARSLIKYARKHNISIETVELEKTKKPVSAASADSSSATAGPAPDPKENINYADIKLELSEVSYPKLKELFSALEYNLRLLDITSYSFDPADGSLTLSLKAYYNE